MTGPSALPAVPGLTDAAVLPPRRDHHRWSVRRAGVELVLHVARERFASGRARRAAEERLAALLPLADAPGLDPVVDGGIESGELWWLTPVATREPDRGPLALDLVLQATVDLAAGLARLHGAGLVAGDVSPEAVVPTADGARLALSPVPVAPPVPSGGGAAPLHVPPEVLEGRPWTAAGDVWALAATAFTLLEGQAPYQREAEQGAAEVLLAVTLGSRPRFHRADVGEPLRRVIERGLDTDPGRRPTASAFGAALVAATGAPPWAIASTPSLPASPRPGPDPSPRPTTTQWSAGRSGRPTCCSSPSAGAAWAGCGEACAGPTAARSP
ncbi:hypothetical protein KSP35_00530 [Aquihabitans sp. G128]|uniref:hypothetical protein n=1 Tax=Aquihabitans sp. G128 TaxID=2849779 RepID=UPI001C2401DF|nr:hypothetical protein [Aquihabitans sp. G128]QXC61377.1 hypothetical protein KSP35_00530 [Aquihabitans sp. G128]